jgi:SAM-dependent methyltransferase
MLETSKTNRIRNAQFRERYLQGKVIDIGAGNDLVCPSAERFDKEDGDANNISRYRASNVYDTVHSSHCLEHMRDPRHAMHEWWKLVRPGGYLIVVVPEEDLYEQGFWPSAFNNDHKWTFRLDRPHSWSPVSHDLRVLAASLPKGRIISLEIHDHDYDRNLKWPFAASEVRRHNVLSKGVYSLARRLPTRFRDRILKYALRCFKVPIDQTRWHAVGQIQAVIQKVE